MAARSNTYRRDNDENELNTVESGPAIVVGEKAKGELADDGTEEGEEINNKSGPFFTVWPVYKGNRGEDDVCREEVVSKSSSANHTALAPSSVMRTSL